MSDVVTGVASPSSCRSPPLSPRPRTIAGSETLRAFLTSPHSLFTPRPWLSVYPSVILESYYSLYLK